ncbi:MAG: DUF6565 domain-containing protein [Bacteroidota bacterium]
MNQNKLIIPLLALFVLSIGISSCKKPIVTKEDYLTEYKAFIDDVKENKNNYSEEDWKKKDEAFKRFSEELYEQYENELGFFEQARIAKYALVYASTRGVKALDRALDDGELEDAIEEFTDYIDKDLKKDIDNVVNDLKQIWDDDLKDELTEKLKELKTKLKDEKFKEDLSNKIDEIKKIINDEDIQEKLKDVSNEVEDLLKEIEKKMK